MAEVTVTFEHRFSKSDLPIDEMSRLEGVQQWLGLTPERKREVLYQPTDVRASVRFVLLSHLLHTRGEYYNVDETTRIIETMYQPELVSLGITKRELTLEMSRMLGTELKLAPNNNLYLADPEASQITLRYLNDRITSGTT